MTDQNPDSHTPDAERPGASQLSAMFDGELPAAECDLLARRLGRDPSLRNEWSRYALIGASLRSEPLCLRGSVLTAVSAALADEPQLEVAERAVAGSDLRAARRQGGGRWLRPVAGLGVAAGVAAIAIFALRSDPQSPSALLARQDAATVGAAEQVVAVVDPAASAVLPATGAEVVLAATQRPSLSDEPASYVVPMPAARSATLASTQLANYVVAHSEVSAPLTRRSLLSALVAADAAATQALDATSRPAAGDSQPPADAAADRRQP